MSFGQTVTINGVLTVSAINAELGLVNGAVLNSEIVFPGTATGRRIGPTGSNVVYTFGPAANIHGGPFTIGAQYGGSVWGNISVVNQGVIAADVAGQTATISPTTFTNAGVLTAGPGNLTINTSGTWSSSAGTININGVTFSIDGTFVTAGGIGTWSRKGGAVNVPGTIDNTGGTVNLNAGTGEWTLTGGSISGGVINIGAGGALGMNNSTANRLSNTTIIGNITLGDAGDRLSFGQAVTVSGVVTVSGANAEIGLVNGAVLSGEVVFPGNAAGRRIGPTGSNATITFGPGANIHGGQFAIGVQYGGSVWGNATVVNQGAIRADTAGQTVTINPTIFTNTGTLAAGPGNITIAPTNAAFINDGTIRIAPESVVNVTGTYTQSASGSLHILVQGGAPVDTGRLIVSGNAALNGALTVEFTPGFAPGCINIQFLSTPLRSGQFSSTTLPPPPDDHQSIVVYTSDQVRFAISPPSDYNRDGVLNSQDFFEFLSAFFNEKADFNGDGQTNSQDFFDFLADFFEGCG